MKDFIMAALPWVLIGLALALACAMLGQKKKRWAAKQAAAPGEEKENGRGNAMALGMCMGECLGMGLALALDVSLALGMCLGMAVGMAAGLVLHKEDEA